ARRRAPDRGIGRAARSRGAPADHHADRLRHDRDESGCRSVLRQARPAHRRGECTLSRRTPMSETTPAQADAAVAKPWRFNPMQLPFGVQIAILWMLVCLGLILILPLFVTL